MKILFADDQVLIRRLVRGLLRAEFPLGMIEEAEDGLQLVKSAISTSWDLVIADIKMPVMDGFEAIRAIKRCSPNIPMLALSSHTEQEYMQMAFDAGASGYVHKYKMHEDLCTSIRDLLKI
jgi:DNA-binding NarL/FixJ family response regulator